MLKQTLIAAAVLLCSQTWAVNKCTGADGRQVYQDAPCAGQGTKMDIRPSTGTPDPSQQADAQAKRAKLKLDNEMAEAIRAKRPMVGMTSAQLQEAMGQPTKVNANNYGGTQADQVIYERSNETWLVYTRNGVVESVQHRPGAPTGSAPARASGPCPSQHDINNAITAASSISLSEAERAERWRSIRVMQTCGK